MTDTMTQTPVTWTTGTVAKTGPMMTVNPEREIVDEDLAAVGEQDGVGLNGPFVADLIASCATHERCGVSLFKALEAQTNNPAAKHRFQEFGSDTIAAVEAYDTLAESLGVPVHYASPAARMTEAMDTHVLAAFLQSGGANQLTVELKGIEAVLLASTLCVANAALLQNVAESLPDSDTRDLDRASDGRRRPRCRRAPRVGCEHATRDGDVAGEQLTGPGRGQGGGGGRRQGAGRAGRDPPGVVRRGRVGGIPSRRPDAPAGHDRYLSRPRRRRPGRPGGASANSDRSRSTSASSTTIRRIDARVIPSATRAMTRSTRRISSREYLRRPPVDRPGLTTSSLSSRRRKGVLDPEDGCHLPHGVASRGRGVGDRPFDGRPIRPTGRAEVRHRSRCAPRRGC